MFLSTVMMSKRNLSLYLNSELMPKHRVGGRGCVLAESLMSRQESKTTQYSVTIHEVAFMPLENPQGELGKCLCIVLRSVVLWMALCGQCSLSRVTGQFTVHMGTTAETEVKESITRSLKVVYGPKTLNILDLELGRWTWLKLDRPFKVALRPHSCVSGANTVCAGGRGMQLAGRLLVLERSGHAERRVCAHEEHSGKETRQDHAGAVLLILTGHSYNHRHVLVRGSQVPGPFHDMGQQEGASGGRPTQSGGGECPSHPIASIPLHPSNLHPIQLRPILFRTSRQRQC